MIRASSSCRTPTPAKWRTCSRTASLTTNALLAIVGPRLILLLTAGALVERLTRGLVHRCASGEGSPAPQNDIDIAGADLEAAANPAGHFGRDQARARPKKRVIDQLARAAVVDDRTAHALDRLLGAVSPALLALWIAERIVVGDLPHRGLPAVALPVARLAFAYRIPAVFMAPMIVAAAQREMLLNPDNLRACLQPAGGEVGSHDSAVQRAVPDISNIPRKQCIGLLPVGAIVVEHLALGQPAEADGTARSPARIIVDAIRRIRDHQIRPRSRQHRLDIGCTRAIAATDPMVFQQPCVTELSDRVFGYFRNAVRIRQTTRSQTGQDGLEVIRIEADQADVEI